MTTDNFKKHSSINPLQRFFMERFHTAFLTEVENLKPEKILDAGCGEGFTLERLRQRVIGSTLKGIDIQDRAIALGREMHPHLDMQKGSVYELPFEDGAFDTVICSEVLEHLEHPEKALNELARVTRRYAIITVPHEPFFQIANFLRGKNLTRLGNDIEHIQHWSVRGISNLAQKKFTVRRIQTSFPWTIVVAEKKL